MTRLRSVLLRTGSAFAIMANPETVMRPHAKGLIVNTDAGPLKVGDPIDVDVSSLITSDGRTTTQVWVSTSSQDAVPTTNDERRYAVLSKGRRYGGRSSKHR